MTTKEQLSWGARDLVPEGAKAAWGARLIVTQTGDVDIIYDRQDLVGEGSARDDFLTDLNLAPWKSNLSSMLKSYKVSTREAEEVTVYEDGSIKVAGNSNGSGGYFYIAAWLK